MYYLNNDDKFNEIWKKYVILKNNIEEFQNIYHQAKYVWTESNLIPENNTLKDFGANYAIEGVVQKFYKEPLTYINGTEYAFYNENITDIIEHDFYNGEYIIELWVKDNNNEYTIKLPHKYKNYYIDYESGIVIFPDGIHEKMAINVNYYPPAITCYKYVGKKNPIVFNRGFQGYQGIQGNQGLQGYNINSLALANPIVWNINSTYRTEEIVKYGNTSYIAKRTNTGKQPDIETADWQILIDNSNIYTNSYILPQNILHISEEYIVDSFPYFSSMETAFDYVDLYNKKESTFNIYDNVEYDGNNIAFLINDKNITIKSNTDKKIKNININAINLAEINKIFLFNTYLQNCVINLQLNSEIHFIGCKLENCTINSYVPFNQFYSNHIYIENSTLSDCTISGNYCLLIDKTVCNNSTIRILNDLTSFDIRINDSIFSSTLFDFDYVNVGYENKILFNNNIFSSSNITTFDCGIKCISAIPQSKYILSNNIFIGSNCGILLLNNQFRIFSPTQNSFVNSNYLPSCTFHGYYPQILALSTDVEEYIKDFYTNYNIKISA